MGGYIKWRRENDWSEIVILTVDIACRNSQEFIKTKNGIQAVEHLHAVG